MDLLALPLQARECSKDRDRLQADPWHGLPEGLRIEWRADGRGEDDSLSVLPEAKRSARASRVRALAQMRQLTYSAPDQLQSRLKGLPIAQFVAAAQGLRPSRSADLVTAATKASLSSLAHRVADLEEEIAELDARITPLLHATAPELLAVFGVGIDTAAALLVAAGDNPERLQKRRGPTCAGSHRCKRPRARSHAIGSTAAEIAKPTALCGTS